HSWRSGWAVTSSMHPGSLMPTDSTLSARPRPRSDPPARSARGSNARIARQPRQGGCLQWKRTVRRFRLIRSSRPRARPAPARHLAAVRLAGDAVRKSRDTARMLRRLAAGEQADGQVEAAPPEMDRTGLAGKACAEALESRKHRRERFPEPSGGVSVVLARRL